MAEFIQAFNGITWPAAFAVVGVTAVIAWFVVRFLDL